MNIKKLGTNIIAGITTIACVGAGVKSCNKHTEKVVQNIKYELKHNPKDSIFWTIHCGADRYINEQKRVQALIDLNAENEPLFSKIKFWEYIARNIEEDKSIRKSNLLDARFMQRQMDAGLRQVYRHKRHRGYKGFYYTQEVKWVPKAEAERLVKEEGWNISTALITW